MKSILLTSTALVAFAGAAAADGHAVSGITFSGEATLGYNTNTDQNDDVPADAETQASEGFFWDASVDVTMTSALDNGLVATATFGLNVVDQTTGENVNSSDYVLSLSGENASLTYGNVDPVAEDRSGFVDGATTAGFNDKDVHFSDAVGFEAILVGEATFAGFTGAVSFGVDGDGNTAENDVDALQLHVKGTVSIVDLELAYQDEFAGTPSIFGIGASASFSGADFEVTYQQSDAVGTTPEETYVGLSVAYPFGPVTASAYYSINDENEDNYGVQLDYAANDLAVTAEVEVDGGEGTADDLTKYRIEGSYDVGNGLEVFAGYLSDDGDDSNDIVYVAGEYDLGGGAEILVSYADDGDDAAVGADLGDPEYKEGATVQVSFEF